MGVAAIIMQMANVHRGLIWVLIFFKEASLVSVLSVMHLLLQPGYYYTIRLVSKLTNLQPHVFVVFFLFFYQNSWRPIIPPSNFSSFLL